MANDKIKGITVDIGGDTSGLNAALKDVNKEAADVTKELKAVEKVLKLDPTNVEMLAQKEELLGKQAEIAAKKVDAVKQAQDQFNKMVASGEIEKGSKEYNQFQREVAAAEASLKKANDTVKDFANQNSIISKLKDAIAGVKDKVESLKDTKAVQALSKGFEGLSTIVKTTAAAVGAIGTAVGAAAVATTKQLADATNESAAYADNVATLSVQTGIAIDKLQAYGYAAELVDVSTETITGSMAKQIKSMSSAAEGSAAYADAYSKLGVAVTESDGSLRDSETVYWELIDALGNVENETERDALAMQIFGKSAQELNPLIKAGSERMQELADEAQAAGAIMSEDTINSLLGVSDAMETMKASAAAATNNIGTLAADAMTDFYDGTADIIQSFTEMVQTAASGGEIPDAMIGMMADSIAGMIESVSEEVPAVLDAETALFNAVLEAADRAMPDIVKAVEKLLPQIIGTLLDALPEMIKTGMRLFTAIVSALPEIIREICDALPELIDGIVEGLLDSMPALIDAGVMLFVAIVENLPEIVRGIVKAIPQIIDAILKALRDHIPDLASAGGELIKGLWQGISDMGSWMKDKISGFVDGVVDNFKDFFGIHSPSRLFRDEIGKMLALGVGEGFTDEMKDVTKEMQDALPTSLDTKVNAAFGAANSGAGIDEFDVTIPLAIDGQTITKVISKIQYNRQLGMARVTGVRT